MTPDAWFLSPDERGNPATEIDRRRHDGLAYTDGNEVRVLIHGAEYFSRLHSFLRGMKPDEWIHFTDWRGDPDERLDGPGTEFSPNWPRATSMSAGSFGGRTPTRRTSASRRTCISWKR
jgi:hypothetical protein